MASKAPTSDLEFLSAQHRSLLQAFFFALAIVSLAIIVFLRDHIPSFPVCLLASALMAVIMRTCIRDAPLIISSLLCYPLCLRSRLTLRHDASLLCPAVSPPSLS